MSRTIIVDENDKEIGLKKVGTLVYEDIYRVTALWLTDEKTGDVLLAQRKWNTQNDPGKWHSSVAGTVDEDETYDVNIVKETEEEIGLTNLDLERGPKQFVDDGKHKFFLQWFQAKVDKDKAKLVIQEDEVEAVKWVPIDELLNDVKKNPQTYVPSFPSSLKTLGYKL